MIDHGSSEPVAEIASEFGPVFLAVDFPPSFGACCPHFRKREINDRYGRASTTCTLVPEPMLSIIGDQPKIDDVWFQWSDSSAIESDSQETGFAQYPVRLPHRQCFLRR